MLNSGSQHLNLESAGITTRHGIFLLIALLTSGSIGIADEPAVAEIQSSVTFFAMGDVPYSAEDDLLLPQQIAELPRDAEFVVHLGDIKTGASPCSEAVYMKVADMLGKAVVPVFIIPGDNEWNDCHNVTPDQAWMHWRNHFMRFDQRWHHHLPVFRQLEREENFSFVKNGVLFVGLNLVGGRVHDAAEWNQRHADCLQWVRRNLNQFGQQVSSVIMFGHALPAAIHDDFFGPFNGIAESFGKPMLYLHGDGHRWIEDRPFTAKNVLRVQVDQGGIAPPLKITVTKHSVEPFVFDRRMATPR
jgi:hypothetical protein